MWMSDATVGASSSSMVKWLGSGGTWRKCLAGGTGRAGLSRVVLRKEMRVACVFVGEVVVEEDVLGCMPQWTQCVGSEKGLCCWRASRAVAAAAGWMGVRHSRNWEQM